MLFCIEYIETQTSPKYALLRARICCSYICLVSDSSSAKIDKKKIISVLSKLFELVSVSLVYRY